jgi:hypothetical protein
MPSIRKLLSTLLLSTPLAACAEMGERAQNGCPTGETCSPITPEGLSFSGAPVGDDLFGLDDELYPTAVGGTQRVALYDNATGRELFAAHSASTDIAGVTVAASDGNNVTLAASAAGSGRLRIDATDGKLMDRIAIEAAPIASASLTWPWLGDAIGGRRPAKLWAGARANLVIALYDANGRRVVDESATIRLTGAGTDFQAYGWDSLALRAPAPSATSIEITAGGQPYSLSIDAVDALDAVEAVPSNPADVQVDDYVTVCFVARSGDAHVLGAPWQFAITGAGTLGPTDQDGIMDNCAPVRATAVGTVTVTASVGARTATSSFAVERNRRAARTFAPIDLDAEPLPVLGERAR